MRQVTVLLFSLVLLTSCSLQDPRAKQKQRWLKESRTACAAAVDVLKQLRRGLAMFEDILEQEMAKTNEGQRPLKYYNPKLLSRLHEALGRLDTTQGKLATRLSGRVWTVHNKWVFAADDVLPRFHRLLVALAELRSTISVARRLEQRYANQLRKHRKAHQPAPPAALPKFGVHIPSHRKAVFLAQPPPPNPAPKPNSCAPSKNTSRRFAPTDPELMNRVRCVGRDKMVYTAHLYHLMQIKLILARIKKLDLRKLTSAFQRSAKQIPRQH